MRTAHIRRPYTPSRQNPKFLKETTVGRSALLENLLESIHDQIDKPTHQHWLLVGPRGIGKSHIIALLANTVRHDSDLKKRWLPVWFPEEGPGITSLRDFMERVVRISSEVLVSEGLPEDAREFNRFLDELNSEKTYYVVDTFGGFTEDDVEYEKSHRGKSIYSFVGFSYNDRKVWEKVVLKKNRIERVRVIQNDIKKVDFPDHVRFSTAFIDVDLYLPTLNALRRIYPLTSAGGRIVVDDIWVHESGAYDGARQAFQEFVSENNITDFEIIPPRCGIIYK